jgi:hypothetical protein
MITFSSALAADITSLGVSKQAYSNTIISYLNANRRIIAKRNGTIFYDAELTGDFQTSGGNIVGIGNVGSIAIQTAADLSTGTCTVEITSGSNYMRGTFGLSKEKQIARAIASGKTLEQATAAVVSYDFTISDNPTTLTGLAIMNTLNIQAPIFLPSGTGPAAPELDADAPAFYQMFSYPTTNAESARVPMGVKAINVRDPDMVFDRPYIAKQLGDIRVMRSAAGDGTIFGTGGDCFKFAPTLLVMHKGLNEEADKPVYRLRFLAKPHGRWASFPYRPDFDIAYDTLSPQAFKIEIYRADMSLIDVMEMYSTRVNNVPGSGKPINGHDQYALDSATTADPNYTVQPWWTCQMSLSWESNKIKPSQYLNALHPGVEDQALDLTNVTSYDAWPDDWPVLTGNFHANGLMAMRVAPKWSRKPNSGFDTNIVDTKFSDAARDEYRTQAIGYGYEPGSLCQHVWFMSPGGSRHERGMWSHYTVSWLSNQNAIRTHGAVPLKELQWHWNKGYHNEGCHYVTNPELGQTLKKENVLYGLDCYNDAYYNGGNEDYRPADHAIRLLTQANQIHNRPYRDKNGRQFTCEYQRDVQHNISDAAQMTYFSNDPMGALEARDSFNSNMLCSWDQTRGFNANDYLTRQHAWQFKHLVEAWTVGNNNPNNFSSAEVEFMTVRHLNWVYDAVMPFMNNGTIEGTGMRDLGAQCNSYYAEGGATGSISAYDSKEFYFANIMMFAKQSGFYDRIRAIDAKSKLALDMMMNSLCQASVDFFVDGNGRYDKGEVFIPFTTASPPAKWNWGMIPPNGSKDWLRNAAGQIANNEGDGSYIEGFNTQHYRAQFLWVMKYYYPEIAYPRLDQAITKVRAWYDTIEAQKNAGGPNWHWRFAMMGIPKPPAKVGPPTV